MALSKCPYCGRRFAPKRKDWKTCGDTRCRQAHDRARKRAYQRTPEYKAYERARQQTPEYKASRRASQRAYHQIQVASRRTGIPVLVLVAMKLQDRLLREEVRNANDANGTH